MDFVAMGLWKARRKRARTVVKHPDDRD